MYILSKIIKSSNITLMWNDQCSRLMVPLSKGSNVATFHLAIGYTRYDEFCMEAKVDHRNEDVIPNMEAPMSKEALAKPEPGVWGRDLHAKFLQGPEDE